MELTLLDYFHVCFVFKLTSTETLEKLPRKNPVVKRYHSVLVFSLYGRLTDMTSERVPVEIGSVGGCQVCPGRDDPVSLSLCLWISNKETINIHGVIPTRLHWQKYIHNPSQSILTALAILHKIKRSDSKWLQQGQYGGVLALPGGGAVVFRRSGGEGDPCGEISALLVLVLALLGGHSRELGTPSAPSE